MARKLAFDGEAPTKKRKSLSLSKVKEGEGNDSQITKGTQGSSPAIEMMAAAQNVMCCSEYADYGGDVTVLETNCTKSLSSAGGDLLPGDGTGEDTNGGSISLAGGSSGGVLVTLNLSSNGEPQP